VLGLMLGCGGKPDEASGSAEAVGAPVSPRDAVIDAWKKGGLTPSAFDAATTKVGTDCAAGKVGALDVLLCVYASPKEAKAAEPAAYAWVGDTTGSATTSGAVMIAVADRNKSDPHGKTINQLMKLASK
jgi:hypothetical protein